METLKNAFSRVNGNKLAQYFFASATADAQKFLRSASPEKGDVQLHKNLSQIFISLPFASQAAPFRYTSLSSAKNSRKGIFQSFFIFLLFVPFLVLSVHAQENTVFPDIRSPMLIEAVEVLRQKGVLSGYPDGTFKPENPINRAEAVKMIFAVTGIEISSNQRERPFSDVPVNTWYAKYVSAAKAKNIVRGYSGNVFRGQQSVNRVEFIKMALLAQPFYKSPPIPDLSLTQYQDLQPGAWYIPFLSYGLHFQFLDEVNKFHPADIMTRGDAAIIMARIQKYRDQHPEFLVPTSENCATCIRGIDVAKEFPELAFHPMARFHQGRFYLNGEENTLMALTKKNVSLVISRIEYQHLIKTTTSEEKIRIVDTQYADEYQRMLEIYNGYQSKWDYMTRYRDPETNAYREILIRGGKPLRECRDTTCKLEEFFVDRYIRIMHVDDSPDWRTLYLYLPDPNKPMTFDDYRRSPFGKMLLFDLIKDIERLKAMEKKLLEMK